MLLAVLIHVVESRARGAQLVLASIMSVILSVSARAQDAAVTAFVNVNVVPMDTEQVLEDYTVVVDAGEIAVVGPSAVVNVPAGAEVIEGGGAYLMPGLADMHIHLNVDPNPDFMRLFLAEGVTTVRNLNALPSHLEWRNEVLRGERVGPTIYTSGPVIVGPPDPTIVWTFRAMIVGGLLAVGSGLWIVLWLTRRLRGQKEQARRLRRALLPGAVGMTAFGVVLIWMRLIPLNIYTSQQFPMAYMPDTEERARAEVRRQVAAGYDLIKVYDWMTRDQYLGAIDEARTQGIYVVGHLDHGIEDPFAAGLREAAHVDEFLDEHLMGEMSPRAFEPIPMNLALIPQSVASVVQHDAFVVSNMVTDVVSYEYLEEGPSYFDRPEYGRMRPEIVRRWLGGRMVNWQGQQEWRRNTMQPFLEQMIQRLHAAGVPILTGTDTGVEGGLPSHIHRELELLVKAGLSPYEALTAGTKNASLSVARMGVDDGFGVVGAGQRADLILLESNPLDDVAATRRRLGVMSHGRWYTQAELDTLVAELVATY
jgi:imidazolonepropionase-like amidohydrolase